MELVHYLGGGVRVQSPFDAICLVYLPARQSREMNTQIQVHKYWIDLKIPYTDLNGPSNLSRRCYQLFYFGDIKNIFYLIF